MHMVDPLSGNTVSVWSLMHGSVVTDGKQQGTLKGLVTDAWHSSSIIERTQELKLQSYIYVTGPDLFALSRAPVPV